MPYSSSRWRSLVISALGELHHVLDAAADVDEPQAVVLQPDGGERGELLDGRLVVGRFVAETGEDDLRASRHVRFRSVNHEDTESTRWNLDYKING